jgi:hypothetical protein
MASSPHNDKVEAERAPETTVPYSLSIIGYQYSNPFYEQLFIQQQPLTGYETLTL